MDFNYSDIRKYVKKPDRKRIVLKHNISLSMVYAVGTGVRNNLAVLESLIEAAETNKKKINELKKRTEKLTGK